MIQITEEVYHPRRKNEAGFFSYAITYFPILHAMLRIHMATDFRDVLHIEGS